MDKYNDFVSKAKAIRDLGDWIDSRKKSLESDIEWYAEQLHNYVAECEANGTEVSEWRQTDYNNDMRDKQIQILTLKEIEKLIEKEMM